MRKLLAVCTTALRAAGLTHGASRPRHAHKRVSVMKPIAALTTAILAVGFAAGGVAASASADQYSPVNGTVAVSWLTTNTSEPDSGTANWPQTPYTGQCGTGWVQNDVYKYDTPENRAIVDALDDDGKLVKLADGQPEDHAVVNSWTFTQQKPCDATPPVVCAPASSNMFEITWGHNYADRNGAAVFTTQSNGGMTEINGSPLPKYMTDYEDAHGAGSWHWLYITKGAVNYQVTYTFADRTQRTATITGADCTPNIVWTSKVLPVPTQKCVATSGWATEDVAPLQTDKGLLFAGPSAPSINTYQRVSSGNMQGLTGINYTISAASGYQAAVVVEVNPNADLGSGVIHYATLSYEPYQNGAVAGQTGTFDASAGLWWTSKIANPNPGSQAKPISWAAMTALMPNNSLLSAPSLHLQTNAADGQSSVVTTISSNCGSTSFVPSKPAPTVREVVKRSAPVCTVNDDGTNAGGGDIKVITRDFQTPYVWDQDTASYIPGTEIRTSRVVTHEAATSEQCPASVTIVAGPSASSCSNVAGDEPPVWISVDPNEHVTYTITGPSEGTSKTLAATKEYNTVVPGTYSVTATADDGYTLAEKGESLGTTHTWTGLVASDSSDCQLESHPLLTPVVTQAAATCSADGSYTLGVAEPEFAGKASWTVNGKTVSAGTHTAPTGTVLHIVATAAEGFGINTGSVDAPSQTPTEEFTVTIANPSTSCGQLKTLAFTGVDGNTTGLLIIAMLLLLGGAGVFTASRLRSRES